MYCLRKPKIKLVIYISIYLLLCIDFFSTQGTFASKQIIKTHDTFFTENIAFFDKEHNKRYLDEFENQTILLVFWASWCPDCSSDMTSLDVLAKDFKKLPFKIIALSEDYLGLEAVNKFYQNHELRHLEKFYDHHNAVFKSMGIVGIPTAFLILPDNKLILEFNGRIKWHNSDIRELILSHIEGNHPMPKNSYKTPAVNYTLPTKNPQQDMDNNDTSNTDNNSTTNNTPTEIIDQDPKEHKVEQEATTQRQE